MIANTSGRPTGEGVDGKVVLILGAAGGIGSACARVLAARGAALFLADINREKLTAVADSTGVVSQRVRCVDITVFDDVASTVDAVISEFNKLDVLINCAGVMYIRPIAEANVAEWNTMIDLNLKGTMWGIAAALPVFLEQKSGHVVSLGSVHGLKLSPGSAAHSASKFGVNAFTEGMRAELASSGIRVTTVNPGAVDTGLQSRTTGTDRERLREIYAHALPPDIIARAVEFAIDQPGSAAVNELVVRPTTQLI